MAHASSPLTALSEAQRTQAFERFTIIRPALEQELSGQTISLKEIEKARSERRKQVRADLSTRAAIVEQYIAVHKEAFRCLSQTCW